VLGTIGVVSRFWRRFARRLERTHAAEAFTIDYNTKPKATAMLHILYVDDDKAVLDSYKLLLEMSGFRVSPYSDPDEAIRAIRDEPESFDLIFTDYNMPGISGLDLARIVRTIRADLPVAVTSGFIDEALLAAAEAAGVRALVPKPTPIGELCATIRRLIPARSQ